MKILEIKPENNYTCISCGKNFISDKELVIDMITNPLCSTRCEFKWFFHTLKKIGLDMKNGLFLLKLIKNFKKIDKKVEFSENEVFYEITKYFIKTHLSTIKQLYKLKLIERQWTGTEKEGQKVGNKIGTKIGTRPPLRGVCPLSLSLFSKTTGLSLKDNYQGVVNKLRKWF